MSARYSGNKAAVLGAGLSGSSAALLLRDEGADVTVFDSADERRLLKSTIENLRAHNIDVVAGARAEKDAGNYDLVIISPGIDPASKLATHFVAKNAEVIGELELGWRHTTSPVVAITGTNGKTTTTELTAQMLNGAGQRTVACGNIGKPLCEVVRARDEYDVLTIEVSSFQLETIREFKPQIAVWLNFAPDHLDRYSSIGQYRAAKLRIFENQTADDVAVLNAAERLPKLTARRLTFSAYADDADFRFSEGTIFYGGERVMRMAETKLRGSHNIENLMAALAVGTARGLAFDKLVPSLTAYEPRPHRCEFVREIDGVTFINDSKATNLDALEAALRSQTKPVVLIAGGKDKGFDFQPLRDAVAEKVKSVVLIGEMAKRICSDWKSVVPCELAESLAQAVDRSRALAHAGDVVLFSPGTSSFDMFKSYVDRGDQFRSLVQALPDKP
jgi:UDP-N-acetylmuramoylalanine--D-glutamate ligase